MNRLRTCVALASLTLTAWSARCLAQQVYVFGNLDVTDFALSAVSGTALPLGPATANAYPDRSSNEIRFDFAVHNLQSAAPLDAPQLCAGAGCARIPENTFTPTTASSFIRADSQITSLDTFGGGTSFQLVAETQQSGTQGPRELGIGGNSNAIVSLQQSFSLSETSPIRLSFLADTLLEASLQRGQIAPSFYSDLVAVPAAAARINILEGTATSPTGAAVGPVVFSWDVHPTASNLQQGVTGGTVISAPFAINNPVSGSCGWVIGFDGLCGGFGSARFDPPPGSFQAETVSLPGGDYTLTVNFYALARGGAVASPEPATADLLLVGLGLIAWMSLRRHPRST